MPTLYELTGYYAELAALMNDPEWPAEALREAMDGAKDEINVKAINYAKIIRNMDGDVQAMKAEEDRLYRRRTALANRIAGMKVHLKEDMEAVGINKVTDTLLTIAIQANPASAEILDEKALPDLYLLPQPPKVDKRAILDALKAGQEVTGARMTQGTSLRIR